jgi:hypothetical protein
MTTRPTHVGTIGDKIRIGDSLTINCGSRECLHRAKLDLEDIAARFAADLLKRFPADLNRDSQG